MAEGVGAALDYRHPPATTRWKFLLYIDVRYVFYLFVELKFNNRTIFRNYKIKVSYR